MNKRNILVAMDSFKGSLTSMQAGNAVREGILRVDPQANVIVRPLADGGEGTVQALVDGMDGELVSVQVTGPLGEEVTCEYGIVRMKTWSRRRHERMSGSDYNKIDIDTSSGEMCAIIEIAGAAGLSLVPEEKRNPLYTTTYGVGEVIRDAVGRGCRRFVIGIGGSATNDGGVGMLQALGVHFLDEDGKEIKRGAAGLEKLERIDAAYMMPELSDCAFRIACDVDNPLCGENGCSAIFAPQKGAKLDDITRMDRWLCRYAELAGQSVLVRDTNLIKNDLTVRGTELPEKAWRTEDGDQVRDDVAGEDTNLIKNDLTVRGSELSAEKAELKADSIGGDHPGDGAAGGLGFAFRTFLRGELVSGSKLIIEETGLADYIEKANLIITGEGCLDGQTVMGKAPIGVARLAKGYSKSENPQTVIAFTGRLGDGVEACRGQGINVYYEIERGAASIDEAMEPELASRNLAATVEKVFRRGNYIL